MRSERLTCSDVERDAIAERYVAGKLDDDEAAAFESHFLTCSRCQEAIALAATVREGFARRNRRHFPRRRILAGGAAAALAAVLAGLVFVHWSNVRALRSLGSLDTPPVYRGIAVRGPTSPLDRSFALAMSAYAHGDYDTAIDRLSALRHEGVPPAPIDFFLGASLLMEHRAADAARAFDRVIEAGASPYLTEAHYYRALALLQQDRPEEATWELKTIAGNEGTVSARARKLLEELEARDPR